MITDNKNGTENEKKDHIDTTQIDLGLAVRCKYTRYKIVSA